MDFHLGGTQKEGEYKVLLPSRRHKESMCKSKERGSRTKNKKKRERPRGSRLEKKKTAKRDLCVEKKIKRREQSVATFERDNYCNWFDNSKIIRNLSHGFFPSKRKDFSRKYLYSCVWLLFWTANICDNIIWNPTPWSSIDI